MKDIKSKQAVLVAAVVVTTAAILSAQTFNGKFWGYPRASVNDAWYSSFLDFNHDNLQDLILQEYPIGKLYFFVNNGSTLVLDSFIYTPPYIVQNQPCLPYKFPISDFDMDGNLDLLITFGNFFDCSVNKVRIYWGNTASPYFTDNDYYDFWLANPACVLALTIDFNGDKLDDIFIESTGPYEMMYRNDSARQFTIVRTISTPRDLYFISDDFDNDGNNDLLGYKNGWYDGLWGSYYYRGKGDGACHEKPIVNLISERAFIPYKLQANSLEDDLIDVTFNNYIGCSDGGTLYIGHWDSEKTNFAYDTLAIGNGARVFQILDWNNDGFDDIVVKFSEARPYKLKALLNDGYGNFNIQLTIVENLPYETFEFINVDNDRAYEFAVGKFDSLLILDSSNLLTDVETQKSDIPKAYRLYQNYPNPFNPTTEIRYTIPEPKFVTLKVFNLTGQEIETLVNASKEAGEYHVQWHPSGIPSGVYIYRIQAGNFVATKKLVLLR